MYMSSKLKEDNQVIPCQVLLMGLTKEKFDYLSNIPSSYILKDKIISLIFRKRIRYYKLVPLYFNEKAKIFKFENADGRLKKIGFIIYHIKQVDKYCRDKKLTLNIALDLTLKRFNSLLSNI